ncbi:hypothetical protein K470DRAFT_209030, partial [Piedraia hortae CBS 480.64]
SARFMKSVTSKNTWEAMRLVWMDVYQGPPDVIEHHVGINFSSNSEVKPISWKPNSPT